MPLKWKGALVTANVRRAQKQGINVTMAAAVVRAKLGHPWRNVTGSAERSIKIVQYARSLPGGGAVGRWGSTDIVYFARLEFGFQGKDALGRVYNQPARPTLGPAADIEYPNLARNIKAAL